jgi:putative cell wall-binding protein
VSDDLAYWSSGGSPTTLVLGVGSHVRYLAATDNAGNEGHGILDYLTLPIVVANETTPTTGIEITPSPTGGWNTATVTVTLTATDTVGGLAGSGVANTYYRVGAGATTTYTAAFEVGVEGVTSIGYWSVDNVGHTEAANTATVRIDSTGPVVTHDAVPFYEGSALVTLNATDAGSGSPILWDYYYWIPGWTGFAPPREISWTGIYGTQTFRYYAVDSLGNRSHPPGSEGSFSLFIGVEGTPTVAINGAPTDWVSRDVTLSIDATDSVGADFGSGVATIWWRHRGSAQTTYTPGAEIFVTAEGTSTIDADAVDNVGHAATQATAQVLIDKSGPTVTDDHLGNYASLTEATVTITATDLLSGVERIEYSVDGSGTQTVTATVPSSELRVPVFISGKGPHTLTYTAYDNAGNARSNTSGVVFSKPVTRLGAGSKYGTAVRAALAAFPGWAGVTDVVVASGDDRCYTDPMVAVGLAGAYDAPLLLVTKRYVPGETWAAIAAMPRGVRIHVVGGTSAVPKKIYRQLASIVLWAKGLPFPGSVLIANGSDRRRYNDALAAGPVSYAQHMPLLLVRTTSVPRATLTALKKLRLGDRYIVGGTRDVSARVQRTLRVPHSKRLGGSDRATTAVAIAYRAADMGWLGLSNVGLANTRADADTGGAVMGRLGGPLLFVDGGGVPAPTAAFLRAHKGSMLQLYIFGGPLAVSDGVKASVEAIVNN